MFLHYDRLNLLELYSKVISLAAGMSTHHGVVPQNPQTPQNTRKKNIRLTEESSVPRIPPRMGCQEKLAEYQELNKVGIWPRKT